jgi:hypothetical protein
MEDGAPSRIGGRGVPCCGRLTLAQLGEQSQEDERANFSKLLNGHRRYCAAQKGAAPLVAAKAAAVSDSGTASPLARRYFATPGVARRRVCVNRA